MASRVSLKDIEIGHDDAEADADLPRYFLKTKAYNQALSPNNILILGERGSGKTAIRRQIERDMTGARDTLVATISPSDVAWTKLLANAKASDAATKRLIWEFIICCEVFYQGRISGNLVRTNRLKWLEDLLKQVYGHRALPRTRQDSESMLSKLMELASRLLSGTKYSLNLPGQTIEISLENLFPNDPTTNEPIDVVAKLRSTLREYLAKSGIDAIVLIDHLDDFWSEETIKEEQDIITALLEAAYKMSGYYGRTGLNLCIFLRTDIFDGLRFVNKSHFRRQSFRINWNKSQLEDLICERLRYCLNSKSGNRVIWQRVFNVPKGRPSETAFGFFYNRSFCRPRDLIHFVGLSLQEAQDEDSTKVEPRHVRAAEPLYSEFLLAHFNESLAVSYPFLPEFIGHFEYKAPRFTRTTFKRDRVSGFKRGTRLTVRHGADWFLRHLYDWGFLGAVPKGAKTPVFAFDPDRKTDVERAERLVIHPGLHKALSMR